VVQVYGRHFTQSDTVAPPPSSALGQQALGMSPGEWATFACNYPTTFADLLLSGGVKNITEYCDKMVWDSSKRKIYFTGCGHTQTTYTIVYDDLTNTWTKFGPPAWAPVIIHAYEHNAYGNNTHYHNQYDTTTVRTRDVTTDSQNNTWGSINYTADTAGYGGQATQTGAFEWFPTYGAGGSLMMWKQGIFGIWRYFGGTWTQIATEAQVPVGAGYGFMCYSAVRDILYFGAGTDLYTMTNAGTVSAETDCPATMGINAAVMFSDPTTGNLVAVGGDEIVRVYDPDTGLWTTDTAPSSSFFTTGYPLEGAVMAITAVSIPEYGVTLFMPIDAGTAWLRKGS